MSTLAQTQKITGNNNKTKTLIEEAYRRIKRLIFEQKLLPGQRLVYQDLGKLLNMSQTPIINALNRLDQEGFVAYENYKGFFVKPIDFQEIWDAFGLREAMEVYAVKQAIQFSDAKGMTLLEEKLREHEKYRPERYTRKKFLLNSRFHLQIAEMANNQVLKYALKRNLEHIYLRARLDHYDPGGMATATEEHHKLLERMKKRDIQGGIEIIQNHIQKSRDKVIKCLSSDGVEEEDYF